jgi:hypothetical protein
MCAEEVRPGNHLAVAVNYRAAGIAGIRRRVRLDRVVRDGSFASLPPNYERLAEHTGETSIA